MRSKLSAMICESYRLNRLYRKDFPWGFYFLTQGFAPVGYTHRRPVQATFLGGFFMSWIGSIKLSNSLNLCNLTSYTIY
jgi:hypothetical protein